MDWTTHTWDRFKMSRTGIGEDWNAYTVISSKHFRSAMNCYNANWPQCAKSSDFPGYDIDSFYANTKNECANACQSLDTCKLWLLEEGPDTCWRKYADVGSYILVAGTAYQGGDINSCYYNWMLNKTVPQP
jgi:hypothetical protein